MLTFIMGLVICFWFLSLFAVETEGPLSVQLGASVTLPCSVDTPLPLNELEVQWMRAESGTLVHLFQEGQSRPESQNPSYSSRAEFFTEEIPKGNFSLLLINVTTEDRGVYRCRVHTDVVSNETNVEIKVERLVVTGASEPVSAYAGEDVILTCSVETHAPLQELQVEWVKTDEDILVLLFEEGQNIPESQHERFRDRAEFFTEEIPKGNFSLKLRGVRTEDRGEYMCKVHTDTESVSATAWLRELGSLVEAYTCSAVNLIRILMSFKINLVTYAKNVVRLNTSLSQLESPLFNTCMFMSQPYHTF
ncbi:hypothetical protein JZ751_028967 [Albula glossodonta]|uniref:Ig-like domain-containing protein n=1 Tax=Albula glossodonta TaxID=121402 RepID=A0A8T2P9N2_9TELE|nr:hypothetical protein JZ751_028967 [Albula glossodonta]